MKSTLVHTHSPGTTPAAKRATRGFTLIELGIVIGVIATLAIVVLMGLGFSEAAGISKTCQQISAIKRAASFYFAQSGGQARSGTMQLLDDMQSRSYIGFGAGASPARDFLFRRATAQSGANWFFLEVQCPSRAACNDIWSQFISDPGLINDRRLNAGLLGNPQRNGGMRIAFCLGPFTRPNNTHWVNLCFRI